MTKSGLLLGALLIGFNALATQKGSDFKEVGLEDEVVSEKSDKSSSTEVAKPPQLGENEELVSGTVRVVRKLEMTEVFFKDLKDSYFIPSGGQYSSIFKACQDSEKKGVMIGLRVNTKSRRILAVESSAIKSPAAGGAESKSSQGPAGTK